MPTNNNRYTTLLRAVEYELSEAVRVRPDDTQDYYAACCVSRALEYIRAFWAEPRFSDIVPIEPTNPGDL